MIEYNYGEPMRRGRIEVICGSMFSGKTEELIRRMKRAQFAHQKVEIFDILFFDERDKNSDTLHKLQITALDRKDIVKTITPEDYSEGPITNILNRFGDLWVFGKDVKVKRYISRYATVNRIALPFAYHFILQNIL